MAATLDSKSAPVLLKDVDDTSDLGGIERLNSTRRDHLLLFRIPDGEVVVFGIVQVGVAES